MGVSGNVLKRPENERTIFFANLRSLGSLLCPAPWQLQMLFIDAFVVSPRVTIGYAWLALLVSFHKEWFSLRQDCKADTLRPTRRLANQKKRK